MSMFAAVKKYGSDFAAESFSVVAVERIARFDVSNYARNKLYYCEFRKNENDMPIVYTCSVQVAAVGSFDELVDRVEGRGKRLKVAPLKPLHDLITSTDEEVGSRANNELKKHKKKCQQRGQKSTADSIIATRAEMLSKSAHQENNKKHDNIGDAIGGAFRVLNSTENLMDFGKNSTPSINSGHNSTHGTTVIEDAPHYSYFPTAYSPMTVVAHKTVPPARNFDSGSVYTPMSTPYQATLNVGNRFPVHEASPLAQYTQMTRNDHQSHYQSQSFASEVSQAVRPPSQDMAQENATSHVLRAHSPAPLETSEQAPVPLRVKLSGAQKVLFKQLKMENQKIPQDVILSKRVVSFTHDNGVAEMNTRKFLAAFAAKKPSLFVSAIASGFLSEQYLATHSMCGKRWNGAATSATPKPMMALDVQKKLKDIFRWYLTITHPKKCEDQLALFISYMNRRMCYVAGKVAGNVKKRSSARIDDSSSSDDEIVARPTTDVSDME